MDGVLVTRELADYSELFNILFRWSSFRIFQIFWYWIVALRSCVGYCDPTVGCRCLHQPCKRIIQQLLSENVYAGLFIRSFARTRLLLDDVWHLFVDQEFKLNVHFHSDGDWYFRLSFWLHCCLFLLYTLNQQIAKVDQLYKEALVLHHLWSHIQHFL